MLRTARHDNDDNDEKKAHCSADDLEPYILTIKEPVNAQKSPNIFNIKEPMNGLEKP